GLPKSIVSDRDPVFLSSFWKELFKLMGTKLCYSSAYHPESDGQTEVVNRSVECYLRCFVSDQPKQWPRYLPLAQFWYNSTVHSATQLTPYQALFGRLPHTIPLYQPGSTPNATLDATFTVRNTILDQLKQNLHKAQQRMKHQADKHRQDKVFDIGDKVLLKLRTYRQKSLRGHVNQKLSPRFFGPYTVVRRVGAAAYELDLPPTARIHRVFHVSLLRPFVGSSAVSISPLPPLFYGKKGE
ncbi:hypothetical protein ABTG52_06415, partial [Acinetobacter baumannii]